MTASNAALALILAFGIACTGLGPLRAAEPAPDFTLRTKAADISVSLDAAIKADPLLAINCLAEGKHYAEKQNAEAEAARRSDPKLFSNGGYTFERKYVTASIVGPYISIVRTDYENTGGAHPNTYIDTILWDNSAKKRISIRPFFKDTANGSPAMRAMVRGVISSLNAEKKKRGIDDSNIGIDWYKGIEPDLLKIGPVTLTPSIKPDKSAGLTFHYAPYAVGPYAEGTFEAFVPWQDLQPYLSPEGAAIFGGERLADAKNR
ncbi:MAG: DUF3298 domain-containing protein [Bradyrhizobiaceae bacterium]|nr:MAG: DUF3298 domain-containing protein [Bradyrhizobiaceae bacterium]